MNVPIDVALSNYFDSEFLAAVSANSLVNWVLVVTASYLLPDFVGFFDVLDMF